MPLWLRRALELELATNPFTVVNLLGVWGLAPDIEGAGGVPPLGQAGQAWLYCFLVAS